MFISVSDKVFIVGHCWEMFIKGYVIGVERFGSRDTILY